MAPEILVNIFLYIIFWQVLNRLSSVFSQSFKTYKTLNSSDAAYWDACVVSSLHAALISVYGFFLLFTTDIFSEGYQYTSPDVEAGINFMVGYLLSDAINCLQNRDWAGLNMTLLHHFAGSFCLGYLLVNSFGHGTAVLTFILEFTTPFVNQRWFLDTSGMKQTLFYQINGALMTILWFIIRIVLFGWSGYYYIYQMNSSLSILPLTHQSVVFGGFILGYWMQIVWFSKIMKGLLKMLKKPKESK